MVTARVFSGSNQGFSAAGANRDIGRVSRRRLTSQKRYRTRTVPGRVPMRPGRVAQSRRPSVGRQPAPRRTVGEPSRGSAAAAQGPGISSPASSEGRPRLAGSQQIARRVRGTGSSPARLSDAPAASHNGLVGVSTRAPAQGVCSRQAQRNRCRPRCRFSDAFSPVCEKALRDRGIRTAAYHASQVEPFPRAAMTG